WLIDETPSLRCLTPTFLFQSILLAARSSKDLPPVGHCLAENLLLLLQRSEPFCICYFWSKQRVQEVLFCRVFFQAADQVGHSDVEVFHVDHRSVQNLTAKHFAHGCLLGWRHALQHLRVHHG